MQLVPSAHAQLVKFRKQVLPGYRWEETGTGAAHVVLAKYWSVELALLSPLGPENNKVHHQDCLCLIHEHISAV